MTIRRSITRHLAALVALGAVSLVAVVSAVAETNSRPDGNDHPQVGQFVGDFNTPQPGLEAGCSGTLTSPRVFLTAAQCVDGRPNRQSTQIAAPYAHARTHSGGGLLAYVAGGALMITNGDGTNAHQIARLPQGIDHPSWSPDGRQLVFSDYVPGYPAKSCATHGLWIVDVDGTHLHRLLKACVKQPSWSPDGTKIAVAMRLKYAGLRDADTALAVLNADDTHTHRITQIGATAAWLKDAGHWVNDVTPSWAPDGSEIVYATRGAAGDFHLALVHLDGTPAGGFDPPNGTFDAFPSFSPDGHSLLYARRAANNDIADPWQIVVSGPDGSAAHVIGAGGADPTTPSVPAWSPDGTHVAWSTATGITLAAPDGSNATTIDLPGGGAQGYEPTWQPQLK